MQKIVVAKDDAGQRLDRFLRKLLPGEPLTRIFKLIRTGGVKVNGKKSKEGVRLAAGDELEIWAAPPKARDAAPSGRRHAPLSVLYRDADVLAVDKPPFLLVQKGDAGDEPSLDEIVAAEFRTGDSHTFVPSIAHRLDRGTSGVVLIGLSAAGLRGLTEAFRQRRVEKRYLAVVLGCPEMDEFTVDLPLRREADDTRRGAKVSVSHGPDALEATTAFTVIARNTERGFALIEARPTTGRTHQIRVHLRAAKLPVAGDPVYGVPAENRKWAADAGLKRQFLHAARVELEHPVDAGRRIVVASDLPGDLVRALGWAGLAGR